MSPSFLVQKLIDKMQIPSIFSTNCGQDCGIPRGIVKHSFGNQTHIFNVKFLWLRNIHPIWINIFWDNFFCFIKKLWDCKVEQLLGFGYWWPIKTRLTYNCAHLRLTKESLTIFWVKIIWVKIFLSEIFLGEYFWVKIYFGLKFLEPSREMP